MRGGSFFVPFFGKSVPILCLICLFWIIPAAFYGKQDDPDAELNVGEWCGNGGRHKL